MDERDGYADLDLPPPRRWPVDLLLIVLAVLCFAVVGFGPVLLFMLASIRWI